MNKNGMATWIQKLHDCKEWMAAHSYFKLLNIMVTLTVMFAWLFVNVPAASAASCDVTGSITVDTTWGPGSCDAYIVTGSITVPTGVTLTIQPGTQVRFTADKSITVNGKLAVLGTSGSPVLFTSNIGATPGDWSYIYFTSGSFDATYDGSGNYTGGSTIQYATIEYGGDSPNSFAALRIDGASPFIDHVTVQHNQYKGIQVQSDGRPKLTNNALNDNGSYGISVSGLAGGITISGNTVSNHTSMGIYLSMTSSGNAKISNNAVSQSNSYGICVDGSGGTLTLDQNTATNNGSSGIYVNYANATVQNNTISGNQQGLYLYNTSGQVQNNTITGNGVGPYYSDGAGIYIYYYSSAAIYHNDITNNVGASHGGGIYVVQSSPNITYNHVTGNSLHSTSGQGGGIYVNSGASPIINNNDLYDNSANQGSDLYNANSVSQATVNAKNNYWGSIDMGQIEAHTWHYIDDGAFGLADYRPYRLQSIDDSATPTPAPTATPNASCQVWGFIESDTTWGPGSCNPYIVTGSLIVQTGATLTIQAGTQLRFTDNKAITVNGRLAVLGTSGSPVLFTSNIGATPGDWSYIYFAPTSIDATYDGTGNYTGGSTIQYATLEYGGDSPNYFAALRITSASPFIDHVTIQHNQYDGIEVSSDGRPKLTNNTLNDNGSYGISVSGLDGGMTISGNAVSNHTNMGISLGMTSNGNAKINNNTVSQNSGYGIYVSGYGTLTLDQNTATNNGTYGIYLQYANATVQNNTISGNQRGLYLNSVLGQVQNNMITGNGVGPSYYDGAGIYIAGGSTAAIYHNDITNNIGYTSGGGIYVYYSNPNITYNHITGNSLHSASSQGGGIFVVSGCSPIINNNGIYNNSANQGSDLYNANPVWQSHLNAKNNYWGSTDTSVIEAHIWDYLDSSSLALVDYVPYLSDTAPTPTATPTASITPIFTLTPTGTNTVTPTVSRTPTGPTPTPSVTMTPSQTATITPTATGPTSTPSITMTPTLTATFDSNETLTVTPTMTAPVCTNLLADPSFEAGSNAYWVEASANFGSPLCTVAGCGVSSATGPRSGNAWGWFGGTSNDETASLSQTITIPSGTATLKFYFWIGAADSGSDTNDQFNAQIDSTTLFSANATQMGSYPGYTLVNVNASAFADGGSHTVRFSSTTTGQTVNFNLDDVALCSVGGIAPTFTPTPIRRSTSTPTPTKTPAIITLQSVGAQDGWILESSETSNVGGTMNSSAATFNLGDDAVRKQYRGILSFNTGSLPDNAVITGVTLKVKQQAILGGGNPVTIFQGFMADVKNGFFGTTALQITDFQTAASGTLGPFIVSPVGNVYSINLTAAGSFVNKLATNSGLTQIRLRFKLDDNNNAIANYLSLYSGNAPAASRPQLVITYIVP